tara:strand:- start:27 stop:1499 length:1473 start_codon:yes stop_codon:yes gene_type:complete
MAKSPLRPYLAQKLARASALRESGKVKEAITAYRAVLSDNPDLPDSWYNLGWLLRRAGDPAGALEAYDKALALRIGQPEEVHLNRGVIFADDLLDPSQAQASYRAALKINPLYVKARFNLANTLEDLGERARAASEYRILLKQAPKESEPLARLANLSTARDRDDDLIKRLDAGLARNDLPPLARASLGFALGRLLDQVSEFDLAFKAYTNANALSAASRPAAISDYNPIRHDKLVDTLIGLPSPAQAMPSPGEAIRPVFILGQFRSGSTLLEQILSAHSAVTTAGELPLLGLIAAQHLAPYPVSLADLDPARATAFRAKYLKGVIQRVPGAKGIVTDKRPDNYFHIGLILRLFPDARILHTVRDPRDTCLSNYFLHLSHEQSYATDLSHLGHRYRAYQRLMNHWKSIAGDQILDVDYDALVSSPETIIRATLDFMGLPFEDACLNFQNSRSPVKTASVWQVREPLYTKSSGRWRNYELHIGPLLEALND